MRCSRSPTCPTSTKRILTAAITELWRTGSASWSRDCWPSSRSVRWCVSTWTVSKGATPANDNTFSDTVFVCWFTGKMLKTQSAQTHFLKGFTSPRGVLLTFVSAEPHSLRTKLPWKICRCIIPLILDNNTCRNEPPFTLYLANEGCLFNSAWFGCRFTEEFQLFSVNFDQQTPSTSTKHTTSMSGSGVFTQFSKYIFESNDRRFVAYIYPRICH